ncbi:peptidyl-prolyl cis-trans isomerase A (cyclophilin A) [Terriglobus roseus]|uniref:Peptidyl-prolyl cis-trans isomerase n=2 Tax=Terriglobus roseus TaxID=392734 RepID=A0A1H4JD59_9BACT|nr:peptidyl-prolyl cis-trans isomerase A (cyclophilin A) [Terriglobus roseus]
MLRLTSYTILAGLALALPIHAQKAEPGTPPETPAPAQQTKPAAPVDDLPDSPGASEGLGIPPMPNGPTAIIDTSMGRLTCHFFANESPKTVENFVGLATGTKAFTDPITDKPMKGVRFYDGTTFHRVIANFMIQGGDRAGTGAGDAGYYIPEERSPGLRFDREGRLAMANAGPGTGSTQFFITEAPVPELNGKHTIFGQCDAHSVLIVQSIARVEKNSNDKPVTPVTINKVTIVPEGQPLPADPAAPAAVPAAK